jgi:hypothetical protein
VCQQLRRLLLRPELPHLELPLDLLEVGEAVIVKQWWARFIKKGSIRAIPTFYALRKVSMK